MPNVSLKTLEKYLALENPTISATVAIGYPPSERSLAAIFIRRVLMKAEGETPVRLCIFL